MPFSRTEVVEAVRQTFAQSDPATVLAVLDLYGVESYERERERVQLAIVVLAGGDEEKLLDLVQVAKTDYRDILHWAATGPLSPEEGCQAQAEAQALLERWGKE